MNVEDSVQQAAARADVFRLLSGCFYQPEKDVFLEEKLCEQLASALLTAFPQSVNLATEMEVSLTATEQQDLLVEYSQLFLGPFDVLAKPYGSTYLDGEKVVMGDSTMAVKKLYADNDLDLDDDVFEVPDHVAIELEFLYLLNFKEAQALLDDDTATLSKINQVRREFLDQHLGRWISPFVAKVIAHAPEGFYNQLARLTEECVLSHKALTNN